MVRRHKPLTAMAAFALSAFSFTNQESENQERDQINTAARAEDGGHEDALRLGHRPSGRMRGGGQPGWCVSLAAPSSFRLARASRAKSGVSWWHRATQALGRLGCRRESFSNGGAFLRLSSHPTPAHDGETRGPMLRWGDLGPCKAVSTRACGGCGKV